MTIALSRHIFIASFALTTFVGLQCAPAQDAAPGAVTLFENVRIFDGKTGALSAPSHVLVRGNIIERSAIHVFDVAMT